MIVYIVELTLGVSKAREQVTKLLFAKYCVIIYVGDSLDVCISHVRNDLPGSNSSAIIYVASACGTLFVVCFLFKGNHIPVES